jgi:hypothetical protein
MTDAAISVTRKRAKNGQKGTSRRNSYRARKCRVCKRLFIPKRADARTCSNRCRQTLHRRHRRFDALFPKSSPACDIDWEAEAVKPDAGAFQRRVAADWQLREAERLAKDFALLEPGTAAAEITARRHRVLPRVRAVIRAWRQLLAKLREQTGTPR